MLAATTGAMSDFWVTNIHELSLAAGTGDLRLCGRGAVGGPPLEL